MIAFSYVNSKKSGHHIFAVALTEKIPPDFELNF